MADPARGAVALALAVLLAVGLGACGDDDGARPDDERTEESPGGRDPDDADDPDDDDRDEQGPSDDEDGEDVELLEPADLPAEAVPFADALAVTFASQGSFTSATPAEANCLATNIVAIVGPERLAEAGITPEEFGAAPDLAAAGIDRDDAEEIYDVFAGCGLDYAAATIESIVLEAADPAATRACLDDALDEELVREMALAALLDTVDESPEVAEAFDAIDACTAPDEG